jgi:glycosyltransferase involved in cell wall biosynthesis
VWQVLFPAKSHHKRGGGQIKSRDYFLHCLAHPQLDPFVSFTDAPTYREDGFWRGVSASRVLDQADVSRFDLFFISGRNWKYVPKDLAGKPVVNLLQSVDECREGAPEYRYLKRPALRICVSKNVLEASAPRRNGEGVVIANGIPLDLFRPAPARRDRPVLAWGRKDRALAACLRDELAGRGIDAEVLVDYLPREDWAARLASTEVFVGLPREQEGFYLPALEAMACGAAVVCADAGGNRAFCLPDETCLSPPHGDVAAHADAVQRLLTEVPLRERLRGAGLAMAEDYSLEAERQAFYQLLDERVLPQLR